MENNKSSQQDDIEKKRYDVFISYRRSSTETARNLEQALVLRGLKVFFDMEELDDGKFNEKLYDAIDQSKNAIFLMTKGALDGCAREGDWVRNELERILKQGTNLILVHPSGVKLTFPGGLPPSLSGIRYIEATELHPGKLFPDSVTRIVKRLKGVRLAGQKTDGVLPVLGTAVDEVTLTGLTGQDAKHFKKALGYYNVVRYRSAWAEFKKIEEQGNAFVKYYGLLLGYILDGTAEESDLEEACCAARDLGCTDAMRLFADRHLPNDTKSFDIVPPSECIQWLKKAIANGNADALSDLGAAYENARGVEKNLTTARELYKRSCEAGSLVGQMTYGQDCLSGNAGEKDLVTAGKVLRPVIAHLRKYEDELTAAEYGILLIWYSVLNSNIVKPDSALAERYAKLIIESKGRSIGGDTADKGAAYMFLGMMNLTGAEEPEKAKVAFEYFQKEKAVYDKDGSADYWIGYCHDNGIGVEADPERALEYYENAAGEGSAAAQNALAIRLFANEDESDVERGKMLLKLAAEGGDSGAEHLYGLWLIRGVYFDKNVEEGMKWLEKAAVSDNDADAMNSLGEQYRDGIDGVEIDYEKAFKWFEKGAVGGSTDAMQSLGWAYLNGQGIPRDCNAARKWFVKAAKTGDASAECTLGTRLCCGDFGDRDVSEAIKWWERAAEHGDAVAMSNLGLLYRDGDGVEKDVHKAEEWFVRAAEAGNEDAACTLGAGYYNGVFGEPDKGKALEWSLRAAKLGDATAMNNLGIMYRDGDGVEMNLAGAMEWFRQAADRGHPGAMTTLGFAYLNGDGVVVDKKIAEEWFVKAAETGDADAEVALGTRYAQGAFGEVDYVKAEEWWLKSAQQGHSVAMWNLADVFQRGEKGIEKDLSLSFELFKRSAEAGFAEAMESLGLAYLFGQGTVADEDKAKEWLIRAAENGNSSAECALGSLYARDDYWDKDLAETVKWWTQAAEHGNATAMSNLGRLFSDSDLKDDVIYFDLAKARKWFHDADEAGNEAAAIFLGLDVLSALGKNYETYSDWQKEFKAANPEAGATKRILRKAGSWFQKPLDIPTADNGLAGACLLWLARIARYQEDMASATELYRKAAEMGEEKAKKELSELESGGVATSETNVAPKVSPAAPKAPVPAVATSVGPPKSEPIPPVVVPPAVQPPVGDEALRAEALFLRKARRLKKNDGRIDPNEKIELRELAAELGISVLRREELVEQVEEEFEAGM